MICYKDMAFCDARDCANKECSRNTRGTNYTPDDWWKDKVTIMDLQRSCKEYVKDQTRHSALKVPAHRKVC